MPKHISAVDDTPIHITLVTLNGHMAEAVARAQRVLNRELPNLTLRLHAVAEWNGNPGAAERCREDISRANIVIATMLFMEEHIKSIFESLEARRDECDAIVGCLASGEVIRLTRLGRFRMDTPNRGPMALLAKLRGAGRERSGAGARQLSIIRKIPRILRFIPGAAQDLRAYFLTLQYWLAGSEDNLVNLVRFLIDRYADGPRRQLRGKLKPKPPILYPDVGAYHPRLPARISEHVENLPKHPQAKGTVGVLVMRSYVLAGNTQHYDAVISALEAKNLRVIPAFASGLDARPAVEKLFCRNGKPCVDAVVSLTGFSLVGGPAYNDAEAAEQMLAKLDVPYIAAQGIEFQSLSQWENSDRGLLPVEATMMVAIPELDGATGPMIFGGRDAETADADVSAKHSEKSRSMRAHPERVDMLAQRVERLIALRQTPRDQRRIGVVLFNFPPNGGSTGTAAHLSVFASLYHTLKALKEAGYSVRLPIDVEALRREIIEGNAARYGTPANVHTSISAETHLRQQRWLPEIEAQWGPAPGRHQTDGRSIFVLGQSFGNVFVGIQPAFGYEGDPMRLLFEKSFAPTHAFAAFYRYLSEDFGAHAYLHFGTHGALEFMPGKHTGLSSKCWPDRLVGAVPNFYLYAANNPSEGTIAKRRAAATLISYLTPSVTQAGVYRGLADLKTSIERWRALPPEATCEYAGLVELIQAQAAELELAPLEPVWPLTQAATHIAQLAEAVRECEQTLIPYGLHVVGEPAAPAQRIDLLLALAEATHGMVPSRSAIEALVAGRPIEELMQRSGLPFNALTERLFLDLLETDRLLSQDHELSAIVDALDGRFVRPAPGADLLRDSRVLPTGRNLHGFDPMRLPSTFALAEGRRQAEQLLQRHRDDGHALPESIALVLWGSDNLKSEGGPIAQAMALMGAKPRFDNYGRLCGADLIPLTELQRPRIDVVVTLSGIFRDLLPLQTKLLAEAAYLAAHADEPVEQNFIRKRALAYQAKHGCDLEQASLRVFSNADGAYGSNVNHLIDSGAWTDTDELVETYTRRKCYAYSRSGEAKPQAELLQSMLGQIDLAYQNLESVELGVTSVDHYFDTLGAISRAAQSRRGGESLPVYISDHTHGSGQVRTLSEQVTLETRTRMLNPKWYEAMLEHGYEGVRHIESGITNTLGWSATAGQVAPWVYQQLTRTYMLDEEMRERLAKLNPTASVKVANRLLEAHARGYWSPDENMLEALRNAGEDLEDRLEGVFEGVAA